MAYNLNAKIIMRNDTPQAWNSANPILQKGEVGCAIDEANGIVTFKVGDGIHHWRDLEMRPGKRESSTTYSTAKGDYATLANMPSKPSGCSYVEGAQSYATGHYSHVEGTSTSRRTNLENHMAEMTEAMKKLQYAASTAGVSMTEAIAALGNIYKSCQGNAESINVINTLEQKTQEPLVKMAQALKEEKQLSKNPYLGDFEIPHYDFEDIDIKDLIDF